MLMPKKVKQLKSVATGDLPRHSRFFALPRRNVGVTGFRYGELPFPGPLPIFDVSPLRINAMFIC